MKPICLILSLLLWPTCVLGQASAVLSGEHGSFTRLSVPVPPGSEWRLIERAKSYVLTVEGVTGYDLSTAFRRIGRDRIAELSQDGSSLLIELACNCSATTFLYRDRYVVIDIDDSPRSLRATADNATDIPRISATKAGPALPLVIGMEGPTVLKSLRDASSAGPAGAISDADLREVQRQLSDALTEVSGTDLLVNQDTATLTEQRLPPAPLSGGDATVPTPIRTGLPGLEIRSGTRLQSPAAQTAGQSNCWPADYTDVATWVPAAASLSETIARRRAVLSDSAGAVDPSALLSLARGYLFFGFGAEAIQTLALDASDSRARQALRAMAEVVDESGAGTALSTQTGCPGPVGLWVYLAGEGTPSPSSETVLAFKNLPHGLRLALGGRLAVRLTRDGRTEEAEQVRNSLAFDGAPNEDRNLVDLQIALASEDTDLTPSQLDVRLAADGPLPVGVLIDLAQRTVASGVSPPAALMEQLEDRLFVARGTPDEPALRAELIRAEIVAGHYGAAFERAQPTSRPVPDPMTDLLSEVVEAAAAYADTATFIQIAFHPQARATHPKAQNALARRLLDLGFPEEALDLLDGPAQGGVMGERRYLRAEAQVALGESLQAAKTLSGITTPRASAILSGDDWSVLTADDEARTARAWRQSDWTSLVESGDPTLRDLAILATRETLQPVPSALLSSGRQIADEAAEARTMLEQGLARFAVPAE